MRVSRFLRCSLAFFSLLSYGLPRLMAQGYPITPVPFTEVRVDDRFWSPRIETNRTVTIPYAFEQCVATGRIRNFAIADSVLRGIIPKGTFCTRYGFDDSDVYKIIEGAAYSLHTTYDPKLDAYVDSLIGEIGRAQEKDGYLYTMRTIDPEKSWARERWVNDRTKSSHELYNAGHLYEAAVAHYAATRKRSLLDIALRNADLLCATFGPSRLRTVPGHQVTEIGLAKLYLVTGERKYLDLAKFFLDERGHPKGETYNQDHLPVVEQREAVGHAVRAGYLYAGMADVAALTGDESYIRAIDAIWEDVVGTKLYLTGGTGAVGNIEGFGLPYDLPNLSAYCETCASIATVYWNFRMFLRHGDGRYLDVVERVIYNSFLSGVGMSGDRFFYPNPLEATRSRERSPWFACACCPGNVVRFIPSIPGYIYAHRRDTLFVNLFIGGTATVPTDGGPVTVRQSGEYPWQGNISIAVDPGVAREFTVAVRVPGWSEGRPVPGDLYRYLDDVPHVAFTVDGKPYPLEIDRGFLRIRRVWKSGDEIALTFGMPVRRVLAHERVLDDRGRVALERGPLVYCLEGLDAPDGNVLNLVIPDTASFHSRFESALLGGVEVVRGTALVTRRKAAGGIAVAGERAVTAIPYYAWAHRGRSQMTVWPAREVSAARALPAPTIARRAVLSTSGGAESDALVDQLLPASSNDTRTPYFHWWPKKGTAEWVQLDFAEVETVRRVGAYWFDDTGTGECRVPEGWKVFYRKGNTWKPVSSPSRYGVLRDRPNELKFSPVKAAGIRLEVQLQEGWSAGLYEVWVK
jgi:DUF1680 family protein